MEHLWNEMERHILASSSTVELRKLREAFHDVFDASFAESDAAERMAVVNNMHRALIRQSAAIAEKRIREQFNSPPVSSFAVLLFGSGGRGELTLWSDQDHGIVFDVKKGTNPEISEAYIDLMGNAIRTALEQVGYPPCEGNVLASNPLWRKSLPEWRLTLQEWFDQPTFENVRQLLIMADARVAYGDGVLFEALYEQYDLLLMNRPNIFPRMLQNTLRYKMLVGLLGNLLTEPYGQDAGGIDIKYGAYIPMVNAVRLLALQHQISATSTLERIHRLQSCEGIPRSLASDWEEAFRSVLKFRAMTPFYREDGKFSTRGILPADQLTKEIKRQLKQTIRIGVELQKFVKRSFGTEGRL